MAADAASSDPEELGRPLMVKPKRIGPIGHFDAHGTIDGAKGGICLPVDRASHRLLSLFRS